LQRCLSDAIDNNDKTITVENLEKNALNTKKLLTLVKEARSGELNFLESKEERDELKTLLGIKDNTEKTTKQLRKGNLTPGKRNPERDAVG
jgi:HD superfamily phosphohydrolase